MVIYVTIKDGYIENWATTDCFEESVEIEYDGEDLEELYKYEGCLKVIDNKIATPLKAKAMTLSLEEEPTKTIEIDYERYEEMQEEANQKSTLELMIEALDKSKPSIKKKGYHLELAHSDGTFVWEFVKNEVEDENDGTDYLKPITYTTGMSVEEGKWYILDGNTNECIKTGDNSEWSSEWFDLIEV